MKHRPCRVLLLVALVATVAACSKVESSESEYKDPATLTEVDGRANKQVTFTSRAIERIGVETKAIADGVGGRVVPYSALVYEPDGTTWVFTEVKPRSFLRMPITVTEIRGGEVVISDGPTAGTLVATVGVSELFGAEHELGAH